MICPTDKKFGGGVTPSNVEMILYTPEENTTVAIIPNPTGKLYNTVVVVALDNAYGLRATGMLDGYGQPAVVAYTNTSLESGYSVLMPSTLTNITVTAENIRISANTHVYSRFSAGKQYAILLKE